MHVLHAFWAPGGLALWAEDAAATVTSASQAQRSARPHPFAAPAAELTDSFGGEAGHALLLLPSQRSAPLDSPDLVRARPRPTATRPGLAPWIVPVCHLDPAAALAFLDQPPEGVRLGAPVRFLGEVAALARGLVERWRVVPSLVVDDGGCAARWRPVVQGPDVAVLHALVAAMPPICRAVAADAGDRSGPPATELVDVALAALADAVVRERLAATSPLDELPRRRGRRPLRTPVVEGWLGALGGADGRFDAGPDDVERLRRALLPWESFGRGQTGPARLTLRLSEEPAGDASPGASAGDGATEMRWRLDFLLQSMADPSLQVPAGQVWTAGDALRRWLDRPEELLLAELGRASTIYPELADSLRQARPEALELGPTAVLEFLSHRAGLLDQAGFGVQVPSWWSGRRRVSLKGTATPAPQGGVTEGLFSRESLCRFDWQLAIGDDPLTQEELEALAAAKAPMVRLRGAWVAIDQEKVRRGLEFLERQASGTGLVTTAEVIALATRHPDDADTPLPVTSVRAEGWLGELLSGSPERAAAVVEVDPPEGFRADLRPYQRRGLSWLSFLADLGLGACLADDMGLGKTVQLLAFESVWRARRPDAAPTLLLCPMSLVGNWERESARFAPDLRVYTHHGSGRERGEGLDARLAVVDIVITTYQTATREIDELASRTWARVVLDEAQAIKNHLAQSSKAVRRLDAGHRVALTGTPMENRLEELWSVMDFLNPGLLGSAELFRERYARPIERYGQNDVAELLGRVTRPFILRRLKTDRTVIDDLPDKIEIKEYCRLTTEQASLYQSVVDEMMTRIEASEGIQRRGNVLAAMTKLKQVCNHPSQLLHDGSEMGHRSGKVVRLEEILEEVLAEGDKAILFTQFTEFAEMLLPHLAARFGRDVAYLHGQTSKKRRDEMVAQFQADGGPPLFLLSLKAGGVGLNLTAASHVIHLDRWWNPAVENQATDRAFRIGQRRNVQVRKFICSGTLEERIDQMIESKKALADLVVRDGEGWLTEMSTQDLRSVFALSAGAVGE